MRLGKHLVQFTALSLAIALTVGTMPLSAADFNSPNAPMGSVSSTGSVQLRGVGIKGEGTLFSGDRLNVGAASYAKLTLDGGPKVEVGAGSELTVSRDANGVDLQMKSGTVAFKGNGKSSSLMHVGSFELTVSSDATGSIGFVGGSTDAAAVKVTSGKVAVRNSVTKQSYTVVPGVQRLMSLKSNASSEQPVQIAALPGAIPPSAFPQAGGAAGKAPAASGGMSTTAWTGLIGVLAAAAGGIAYDVHRPGPPKPPAAAVAAQVQAKADIVVLQNVVAAITVQVTSLQSEADQIQALIDAAEAAGSRSSAGSSSIRVGGATTTCNKACIDALKAKLASIKAQINTLKTQANVLTTTIVQLNNAVAAVDTLDANLTKLISDTKTQTATLVADTNTAFANFTTLVLQADPSVIPVTVQTQITADVKSVTQENTVELVFVSVS